MYSLSHVIQFLIIFIGAVV